MDMVIIGIISGMLMLCVVLAITPSNKVQVTAVEPEVVYPTLDTSRMIEVTGGVYAQEDLKGSFGNRYVHLMVFDRDGERYMCFMTRGNMKALHRAGFVQKDLWVDLCGDGEMRRGKPVVVNGRKFQIYPSYLLDKQVDGSCWGLWTRLSKEFDSSEENHFGVFREYYDGGHPRQSAATAD